MVEKRVSDFSEHAKPISCTLRMKGIKDALNFIHTQDNNFLPWDA